MRDTLARRRKTDKPDSPLLAGDLAQLGRNLLKQSSDGRRPSRCCASRLAIREKATPDDWGRYDAMSLLGGSLWARAGTPRPSRWSSAATRG